ncbi:MAG TPA: ATP-binding protein [Polyangia bacterium]|nr:ATP-binding protein [Polyangia bacterium]
MGKLVLAKDWSCTPLGSIASWPQSLRTTVSLCLASNFPISIAWGDRHTQIYNDGYWPICGAKHPASLGQDFSVCWASAWPAVGPSFERALRGETSFLEDQRMFLDRHGYLEETFFTFSFSPIRDESGGVGGLFHPVTETTANMLSQRRMRLLRDVAARTGKSLSVRVALRSALESMGADELDLPFVLVYETAGWPTATLLGSAGVAAGSAVAPDAIDAREAAPVWPLAEAIRTRAPVHVTDLADTLGERFGEAARGPYPEVPAGAMLLPISAPGASGPMAVVVAGISARLPMNEAYRSFYDLLSAAVTTAVASAQAYEDAQKRVETLAALDRAKTAFFSNVSHEFRTPLTLMLGPTEDALASPGKALAGADLEAVHRNGLRLLKLVNGLLDFSRIEAGRAQAAYVATDLGALTADLASAFRSAVERAGLTFAVDCAPMGPLAYVDRDLWEKIVFNLLSNALKFTLRGGIAVELEREGDVARLTVSDTGIGVPPHEVPRLFERFHRVEGAEARTHEGTGIGLALVKDLVELHGGTVDVSSTHGEGTAFTVRIPLGAAHLPAERVLAEPLADATTPAAAATVVGSAPFVEEALRWMAPATIGAAPEGDAGGPRARILVADDNADMRDYIVRLVGARWAVQTAGDGAAALEAARRNPPDLILSDVMMPRLDGFGLLQEVRRDRALRRTPVILLSARAGEEAKVEGLDAGADDYLIKPFSAKELMARIQTHLTLARLRAEFDDAQRAIRMRDDFIAIAGHELRTPLTALRLQIEGVSRAVARDLAPERARERLDRALTNADRLGKLIEGLLDVSRIASDGLVLKREPVDLARLVLQAMDRSREQIEKGGYTVFFLGGGGPCVGEWDALRLDELVSNLVANAIKYGRSAGKIDIGLRQDHDSATLTVTDRGIGIAPEDQERIFNRFERAVPTANFGGFGLGLWISRKIAEAHGGTLSVESTPDVKTTFTVHLPKRPPLEPAIPRASEGQPLHR